MNLVGIQIDELKDGTVGHLLLTDNKYVSCFLADRHKNGKFPTEDGKEIRYTFSLGNLKYLLGDAPIGDRSTHLLDFVVRSLGRHGAYTAELIDRHSSKVLRVWHIDIPEMESTDFTFYTNGGGPFGSGYFVFSERDPKG